jgi:HEAT repeat protein
MTDKNSAQFDDPEDEFDGRFEDEIEDDYADLDDDFGDDSDDELDDELDDDDEFEDDDLTALKENLAAFFAGDDFEIVELAALLRESLAESEPAEVHRYSAVSLAEALHRLRAGMEPPALADVAALAHALPSERGELRAAWPALPTITRRTVLDLLIAAAEEDAPLDLGELLRLALDDEDAVVRRLGVAGLFDDAPPEYLGRLAQMVGHDADAGVRADAAAALGNYVLAGELDELDPALAMRAEEALMTVLADAGAPLEVQCRALESIAFSGEVGVRQLIEDAYYSAHEDLRLSALRAMGRSADVRWRNLAHAELTNPSPAVRAEATFAVGELEAMAALPAVLALTEDDDATVRLAAIYALGHLGGREARARLQAIGGGDDVVEAAAAEDALEEMAFYAGGEAPAAPFYEDEENDDEDWRLSSDSDLGVYN